MEDNEEKLEFSKDYKRAINDAEIIINQFPHLIDQMEAPEGEPSEYTKGFQERVIKFKIERDSMMNMSRDELSAKYGKDLDKYDKDRGYKDRDK